MIDQAARLRTLVAESRGHTERAVSGPRLLVFASGKGGAGKTTVALNLGLALSAAGYRALLVDADLGTANVDILLGLRALPSLAEVARGTARLDQVAVRVSGGLLVVPGISGVPELADLSGCQREGLLRALADLTGRVEVALVDLGAGVSSDVVRFIAAAGGAVVVTTPEPTAVTDAYALIKVASRERPELAFRLIVNQTASADEGRRTGAALVGLARRALGADVDYLGAVPADPAVARSVRAREPLMQTCPGSPAAVALRALAVRLMARAPAGATSSRAGTRWGVVP